MKKLFECKTLSDLKKRSWQKCKQEWLIVKEFVINDNRFIVHAIEVDNSEPEAEKGWMVLKKRMKVNEWDRYKPHSRKINLCKYLPRYKKQINKRRDVYRIKYRQHPTW